MANPEMVVATDVEHAGYYTADMVRALNAAELTHARRYECVYGELVVSPAPTGLHQLIVSRLVQVIGACLTRWSLPYTVLSSPADISWGRDDVTVQPDVFLVTWEELSELTGAGSWASVTRLPLAIEILSPNSQRSDRFRKRKLYQEQEVPVYWILNSDGGFAEVWTPTAHFPTIERETLTWRPEGAAEPLTIALGELFAKS